VPVKWISAAFWACMPCAWPRNSFCSPRLEQQLRSRPHKAVCFHCSNLPKHFFRSVKMDFQEIIAGTVGKENNLRPTCVGLIKPEEDELLPDFSTDDTAGKMRGYVGEGVQTDDALNTLACGSCRNP